MSISPEAVREYEVSNEWKSKLQNMIHDKQVIEQALQHIEEEIRHTEEKTVDLNLHTFQIISQRFSVFCKTLVSLVHEDHP